MIKESLKKYYEDWLDMPIQVLDGKTPREGAKTAEGREILELLLLDHLDYIKEAGAS
ncbi:MAG: hypothetical protein K940chlam9_00069 [Chlamydiae bacterium]|nr:hypothetical protein [Chlamydiota bacterium]